MPDITSGVEQSIINNCESGAAERAPASPLPCPECEMSYLLCRGAYVVLAVAIVYTAAACAAAPDSKASVPVSDATRRAVASAGSAAPRVQSPLPPRARAALDSGNAQLRSRRYDAALASYRVAVAEAPGHVAPEFGVYLAAKRMGNTALADSALRIISAHTGGSPAWTDSAMRSAHGAQALPPSHPAL
jgi:hypothetical protein